MPVPDDISEMSARMSELRRVYMLLRDASISLEKLSRCGIDPPGWTSAELEQLRTVADRMGVSERVVEMRIKSMRTQLDIALLAEAHAAERRAE